MSSESKYSNTDEDDAVFLDDDHMSTPLNMSKFMKRKSIDEMLPIRNRLFTFDHSDDEGKLVKHICFESPNLSPIRADSSSSMQNLPLGQKTLVPNVKDFKIDSDSKESLTSSEAVISRELKEIYTSIKKRDGFADTILELNEHITSIDSMKKFDKTRMDKKAVSTSINETKFMNQDSQDTGYQTSESMSRNFAAHITDSIHDAKLDVSINKAKVTSTPLLHEEGKDRQNRLNQLKTKANSKSNLALKIDNNKFQASTKINSSKIKQSHNKSCTKNGNKVNQVKDVSHRLDQDDNLISKREISASKLSLEAILKRLKCLKFILFLKVNMLSKFY